MYAMQLAFMGKRLTAVSAAQEWTVSEMDEYIKKSAAIDATWFDPSYTDPLNVLTEVRDKIKVLPSADAVVVVRCKDAYTGTWMRQTRQQADVRCGNTIGGQVMTIAARDGKEMINQMSEAALLEGLAEESSELAHAALKLARILRDENPTPVRRIEARAKLVEEMADVILYSQVIRQKLGIQLSEVGDVVTAKHERWEKRLSVS